MPDESISDSVAYAKLLKEPGYLGLLDQLRELTLWLEQIMRSSGTLEVRTTAMLQWALLKKVTEILSEKPQAAQRKLTEYLAKNPAGFTLMKLGIPLEDHGHDGKTA